MPRKPNPVPTYRFHRQSGQAVATVRTPDGGRRDVLLGKYNSPESKAEYERLLSAIRTSPAGVPARNARRTTQPSALPTVNEVLLAFMRHATVHYRRADGAPTSELKNYRHAVKPVRELYGHTPAAEFGPLALKQVREKMIAAGWCRPVINKAIHRVRRVFRWATGEELIPVVVHQSLATVAGLARGRTTAREPAPVRPVDAATVAATLPFLNRQLRAMVQLQQLAGLRPDEACQMTGAAIDRSGPVWVYELGQHKTLHRGGVRRVRLGPQAQAILAPFLGGAPTQPLFSPQQAATERHADRRAAAKGPIRDRCQRVADPDPTKSPAAAYCPRSYRTAVYAAVGRANRRRERLAGAGNYDPVPSWSPNQLRHAFATAVRKKFGLEAAQVLLGHSQADVTQIYAERDDTLAEKVAREVG